MRETRGDRLRHEREKKLRDPPDVLIETDRVRQQLKKQVSDFLKLEDSADSLRCGSVSKTSPYRQRKPRTIPNRGDQLLLQISRCREAPGAVL